MPGLTIRQDVKDKLDAIGRTDDWIVNWTTDGESKQVNARAPGKHDTVGLKTNHTASCVSHTAHLAAEDSLEQCSDVKIAVDKGHRFVNKINDSNLKKEAFFKIIEDAGDDPLAILRGTTNRWYFKFREAERLLLLRVHVERFQEINEDPEDEPLDEDDWHNIAIYVNSIKTLSHASDLLEGETYPTASNVIPYLDTVFMELGDLARRLPPGDKDFPQKLLKNLQSTLPKRFPGGYKTVAPFNCLTLTNPKYMDIYFTEAQKDQALEDIANDVIFDLAEVEDSDGSPSAEHLPVSPSISEMSSFARRRAELLATKQASAAPESGISGNSLKNKLKAELTRFLGLRETVEEKDDPQQWWREHVTEFPLLGRYYRAYCAFQATSTASERVFNAEGMVVTKSRYVTK